MCARSDLGASYERGITSRTSEAVGEGEAEALCGVSEILCSEPSVDQSQPSCQRLYQQAMPAKVLTANLEAVDVAAVQVMHAGFELLTEPSFLHAPLAFKNDCSATSSDPGPAITSMFPPITADYAFFVGPLRCWPSWRRSDRAYARAAAKRCLLARDLT